MRNWRAKIFSKESLALILALCLLAPAALTQEDIQDRTLGSSNGKYWNESSKSQKLGYLRGFYEALMVMDTSDGKCLYIQLQHAEQYASSLSDEEMVAELDSFFGEESTESYPLTIALHYVASKAKGAAPKQLEQILARNLHNR